MGGANLDWRKVAKICEVITGILIVLSFGVVNIIGEPVLGYLVLTPAFGTFVLAAQGMSEERAGRIAVAGALLGTLVIVSPGHRSLVFAVTVYVFGTIPWVVHWINKRKKSPLGKLLNRRRHSI